MVRNLVVLADGTEVFSGSVGSAVMALEISRSVSNGSNLAPGAVCAAMAQLTLLDEGDLSVTAGDALSLFAVDESGQRRSRGVFLAQKPERNGRIVTVTAYDGLIRLDRDLTGWLGSLQGWPYSLQEFWEMVCTACALEPAEGEIPNGDLALEKFSADGVTGRQLVGWIAEAAGCFCRLNGKGQPELGWYTPASVSIGPEKKTVAVSFQNGRLELTLPEAGVFDRGTLHITCPQLEATHREDRVLLAVQEGLTQQYCYQGALALEDYVTAPVERVQLRQSAEDIGTCWPEAVEGNTLTITGNPLLAAKDAATLLPVAQRLFERLQGSSYTPCTLELPDTPDLTVGQTVKLFDSRGQQHLVYVMELTETGRGLQLRCTGNRERNVTLGEREQIMALQGKVLKLKMDLDGILVENGISEKNLARLEMDIQGLRSQVQQQKDVDNTLRSSVTRLEQSAENIHLAVEKLNQKGVGQVRTAMGYTFDDTGLRIASQGQEMENRLDHTGMQVCRSGQPVLKANHRGVTAVDVTVGNYLVIGDHARFEDYGTDRTACFYVN